LGDRIAIMEGGRIVQWGTPRDIYSNPANEYVADFVAHMNPLGVLCAQDVMEPFTPDAVGDISADGEISDVIRTVLEGGNPVAVKRDGEPVGQVSRSSVLRKILGDDPGH
ncbi:MAG: choline ABC transporter ATP-binding protein, partial [Boseongicola sp.]